MAAIWSSLFRQPVFPPTAAPCVRPVGSPATKLPFRRRPAALLTLKHKYPPSPPPHPLPRALSISLPDLLSSIAVSFPIFFPFFPLLPPHCVFHFHSHLSYPLVKTYLLLRLCLTSIFWPGNVFFFFPILVVLNRTHLHTPLSSITLSFCRLSFHLKLFMNPAKLNNTSDSIFFFFLSWQGIQRQFPPAEHLMEGDKTQSWFSSHIILLRCFNVNKASSG